MTEIRDSLDLDAYSTLLTDLETEIRAYGIQRASLQEMVSTLQAMDATLSKLTRRVEASIGTGEIVFDQLKDLDLPEQIASLRSRYDEHQQALSDVSSKVQQMVQEQQRASLETLQNSQHTRESLERNAKEARTTAEAHEGKIAGVAEQVGALSDQLSEISTNLRTHGERLAELQREVSVARIVAIVTLAVLILFSALAAFNVL